MQSLQPWCVARVVELLNDASVLYLHSAQRGLRELVHSAVQKCGVAVRRRGVWRVRQEQSGVWKCMTLAYMEALPDIKIMMQTDWSFPCSRELVIFLRQASWLYRADGLSNGVVFHAVQLDVHGMPHCRGRADNYKLASQRISVKMRYYRFAVDVIIYDVTPWLAEPTLSLRVNAQYKGFLDDEPYDMMRFRALCPADPAWCSEENQSLHPDVWAAVFYSEQPRLLPMLFVLEFL